MRKFLTVAVSATLLTACGSAPQATPAETVYVTQQPAAPEPTVEEEIMAHVRHAGGAYANEVTEYDVIDLAETVCSELDEGKSVDTMMTELVYDGALDDPDMIDLFISIFTGATVFMCPQHLDEAQTWAANNS